MCISPPHEINQSFTLLKKKKNIPHKLSFGEWCVSHFCRVLACAKTEFTFGNYLLTVHNKKTCVPVFEKGYGDLLSHWSGAESCVCYLLLGELFVWSVEVCWVWWESTLIEWMWACDGNVAPGLEVRVREKGTTSPIFRIGIEQICLLLLPAGMWWLVGCRQREWPSFQLLISTAFSILIDCCWFVTEIPPWPLSFHYSRRGYQDICLRWVSFRMGVQGRCRRGTVAELISFSSVLLLRLPRILSELLSVVWPRGRFEDGRRCHPHGPGSECSVTGGSWGIAVRRGWPRVVPRGGLLVALLMKNILLQTFFFLFLVNSKM